jgi:hypothetical protein
MLMAFCCFLTRAVGTAVSLISSNFVPHCSRVTAMFGTANFSGPFRKPISEVWCGVCVCVCVCARAVSYINVNAIDSERWILVKLDVNIVELVTYPFWYVHRSVGSKTTAFLTSAVGEGCGWWGYALPACPAVKEPPDSRSIRTIPHVRR